MQDGSREHALWYVIGYIFLGLAIMYTIFAGFAYLFLYKWRGKFYWESKIQQYYPERKHIMREIWLSVSTLVIFGVVLIGVAWANYTTVIRKPTILLINMATGILR